MINFRHCKIWTNRVYKNIGQGRQMPTIRSRRGVISSIRLYLAFAYGEFQLCSFRKRNPWTRMSYHVLYLKLFPNQSGVPRRLMAAARPSFSPHRSSLLEFPRSNRPLPPFSVRFSAKSHGACVSPTYDELAQGPHCIYVGPIESASQETLEALYLQARDAYYSGKPLIVDDMFDRVELKLRWYGSKSVVKYPRCSIRRQSTYADAEADLSMIFALASTWIVFLAFGSTICVGPVLYTVSMAYHTAFNSGFSYVNQASGLGFLATVNSIVFMSLGCIIGYPVASASVKVLHGLWRNDLVALKGACPNCGEEVFAFVRMDKASDSPHRADCHVCGCLLEFQTQVEESVSRLGRKWIYGRIYLVSLRGRSQRQRRL